MLRIAVTITEGQVINKPCHLKALNFVLGYLYTSESSGNYLYIGAVSDPTEASAWLDPDFRDITELTFVGPAYLRTGNGSSLQISHPALCISDNNIN